MADEEKLSRRKNTQERQSLSWWKKFKKNKTQQKVEQDDPTNNGPKETQSNVEQEDQHLSRSQTRLDRQGSNEDDKRKKLGRRLDIIIAILIVLIILVYVFMRFVNF
ncbi:hypothetical protein [Ligilactobacillus pobuzihii]|uniref:Uncharacterized protein n=1 Tax=Ligilactobacillus pobuzihii TaxID=449659 RepID=A0A0R2LNP7_9LACO|nr:hypothetical protein [Ligilactobacillus pobuzihii]KRK10858.1 hypothetical protein FD11_GL001525 [Ligilactobacillus pobuzihii E100301 = KCTC 13174]KRO01074.1 hypothetical protein IV66_GL001254 [Ligilactobacillus pobuzihii]GEN47850.1 hypothetical protein LPO01_06420 [Ligilactobacillus pobuzihii]